MQPETRCIRITLKPGSLPAVREWQEFLAAHRDEVIGTLKAEGVVLEAVFLDRYGADDVLIYVMTCADFVKAQDVATRSKSAVDAFHRKFKQDWWAERLPLEPLLDFYNLPE